MLALAAVACATSLALVGAGCGSSSVPAGPDPATAVPASAPLYIALTVRPHGSLKDNTVSVARKLSHVQDPFGQVIAALQRTGSGKVDFNRDIKPWLGANAGAFFTSFGSSGSGGLVQRGLSTTSSFGSGGTQGALVLDVSDEGKARSFLQSDAKRRSAHAASYRGVGYQVTADGNAEGIVGKLAVFGSEAGLHSVVDTEQGGAPLSTESSYAHISATRPAQTLGDVYINFNGLLDAIHAQGSSSSGILFVRQALASAGLQTADFAITVPSATSVGIDSRAASTAAAASSSSGTQALAGLPGDSWFAVGIGNLGGTLTKLLSGLEHLGSLGGVNVGGLLGGLNSQAGFDIQHDLIGWMGDTGLFVRGTGLTSLEVALVIQSKDPALSRIAVAKLARLLRRSGATVAPVSLPGTDAGIAVRPRNSQLSIDIVDGQGKFAIGLGDASVQAALSPSGTLAGTATYAAAQSLLGGIRPSFLLSFPPLLQFLEGIGLGTSTSYAKVKPYLQSLTALAAGGQRLGDVGRYRIVLGVH